MKIVKKLLSWYFSKAALPYWCILVLDGGIVALSGYVSQYLEVGGLDFAVDFRPFTRGLFVCLTVYMIMFRLFHTYSYVVRYSSFKDLRNVAMANVVAMCAIYAIGFIASLYDKEPLLLSSGTHPWRICVFATLAMMLLRMVTKNLYDLFMEDVNANRAFIYGIREGGVALAKGINLSNNRFTLVGFIAPKGDHGMPYLMGVPVYAQDENVVERMKAARARVIIVSPLQVERFRESHDMVEQLIEAEIKIMMVPSAEEWDGKTDLSQRKLKEVDIEDLLPRAQIQLDMDAIGELLCGKRILITGAAGSIGSEMVRQVALFRPEEMILIDQAETPMHDIRLLMSREFSFIKTTIVVSTICNQEYMEGVFKAHRPDYVFHAAAYKHVPMMEDEPVMAVMNNVMGTRIIADLSVKYGVKKFVMISTDKAVNPTNVMGCSKRICEIYCQSLNQTLESGVIPDSMASPYSGKTQFVTTRFGNVLGSNGSVIPIFKKQIRNGGPLTVTHPDIVRYFMLIPEACKLVLEAGTMGHGGEIFVFDMGTPVKILDLAKRMIALSGAEDIEIRFSGLRDGEKLYEEVLASAESTLPTNHPKIYVAKVRKYDYATALANEERLMQAAHTLNNMEVVKVMKEIVPEYKSNHSAYEVLDKK
ncbi:MAG: polysaccharide biosynthesis protein [Prevotellaceae bacterium]|nr:polysaccharide biosynthesis protein [Candidatus Minthosoma equi]